MRREKIAAFFDTFQRDWPAFRMLWTDDPVLAMPFAPPGFASIYEGASAFDAFWYPVFHLMTGHFVWTVRQVSALSARDEILVLASSEVDAQLGDRPLRYRGDYVQIFRFEGDRIARLTEYFDSHRMALAYGTVTEGA